ncbi:MAG: LysR family transcriptional regulator [Eubacteriaceae bacterium]|jgi:DNA-binding transcriptional LysR family regulator|nr:LysR family transcriptional regulator [Eubacteriaceae bacterium]
MITYSTLQYFKVVAETQSFTKAAKILHISQPALSHTIKTLQADIGCPLFNYKGRGVTLNTYGKIYLEYVTDALKSLEEGEERIHSLISPDSGTIRIACLYSLGVNLVPFVIRDFKQEYPNVTIEIMQQPSRIQLEMLSHDEIDLCFCTDFNTYDYSEDEKIEKATVLIEDLYVLVNKSHRFAKLNEINIKDLDNEDFISFSSLTFFKRPVMQLFEKFDIHPNIVYECNEDSGVAGLVAAGLGVAIIPPVVGVDFEKCVPLRISYPICQRTLCMAWKKDIYSQPAVKNFRDFTIKWLPSNKKFNSPFYP